MGFISSEHTVENFTITVQVLARSLANFYCRISGQTHEFIIYGMRQRAKADNWIVCHRKKQIGVSVSCVCHFTDNEFRRNIVKVVCGSTRLSPCGSTATLTML